ncbi:MAG: hypothetical protein EXS08_04955 [Planctomycetes bacterium]|nr:hypothetical protein [Planctomycetota bacterium]
MQVSPFARIGRSSPFTRAAHAGALVVACLATACGGASGSGGQSGNPGDEALKPGGGTFFVDENHSGGGSKVHLAEVRWGRMVDIHEIDNSGRRVELPVFTDFVIEPTVATNGTSYVLDRNPVTQRERLTIKAKKRNLGVGETSDPFDDLLAAAVDALPTVLARSDTAFPPFTVVARNSCMVLRIDDCLEDDLAAQQNLPSTVKVLTGYPPTTPFSARIVFDSNHGAVVGGNFHSTRVLIDMTTSEAEANALPVAQDVNPIGLPESLSSSDTTNTAVRIPTRTDLGTGQVAVLTNLSGAPLDAENNGPIDLGSLTVDVVRAVRSGNSLDSDFLMSNGFLKDETPPSVLGAWPVTLTDSGADPAGDAGLDFLVDLSFTTTCLNAPAVGDVVTVGDAFLQVTQAAALAGSDVSALKVRSVAFLGNPLTLLGSGLLQTPFLSSLPLSGCWVGFLPEATTFPSTGVSTTAQILLRFSEPMDPATLSPFRQFLVVDGPTSSAQISSNLVVGEVLANNDLTLFSFNPGSPLRHDQNSAESYHVFLDDGATDNRGPKDLAGNDLLHALPKVGFTLDPLEATQHNRAVVLKLDSFDEYAPNGGGPDTFSDLRGQFFFNGERGSIFPRPVSLTGYPADRTNLVPANMFALGTGVFTPLNPLGAKLQTVWRYCDVGWNVRDETKYNLDVVGLSWSPIGGLVFSDFYEQFEIRLGHSRFLPDELPDANGLPALPNSGLPAAPATFANNYLGGTNPAVVHNRALGYTVNPATLFNSTTGTPMIPFPLNRGLSPDVTYTWRDTSILTKGADGETGADSGIPLGIERGPPSLGLNIDNSARIALGGNVPSFGLALLIELRCYPADRGLGLNRFDVSIANTLSATPNFRVYSAGGINTSGNPVIVLPDSELVPAGGFNPGSTPPGRRTALPADNVFYIGQLDTVVRVSRVHTAWLDAGLGIAPEWKVPVLEPSTAGQPSGTDVLLDFRSATGFTGGLVSDPFNASKFDVYGDAQLPNANPFTPTTRSDWSSDVGVGDGKRYLQVRLTFVNNIATGLSPELTGLALPFGFP